MSKQSKARQSQRDPNHKKNWLASKKRIFGFSLGTAAGAFAVPFWQWNKFSRHIAARAEKPAPKYKTPFVRVEIPPARRGKNTSGTFKLVPLIVHGMKLCRNLNQNAVAYALYRAKNPKFMAKY